MSNKVKIAGAQINPIILDIENNLNKCLEFAREAVSKGAKLTILPEAALTGYCFTSLEEAIPVAETIPGISTEKIIALCQDLGTYVIVGLIEKENNRYYNAAVLLGPEGLIGKYRKLHLPYLGVDRFLNHGNLPLTVYNTEIGRIGIGICFDVDFPEHSRVLALKGADIVVNITNFPGPTINPRITHCIYARAIENTIYYIAVNRVGTERGWNFFGSSMAIDPQGKLIAQAKENEEEILYIEIDPTIARQKYQVMIPEQLEMDLMRDRRPEYYSEIVRPIQDKSRIR